jgi:small subunit ribosomal protein S16
MAMKLRLARHGRKNLPYYWIMAADSRFPRNRGKEKLGTYNPLLAKDDPKRVVLNNERIEYWLSHGAQPTDRVRIFLTKAGLLSAKETSKKTDKKANG